jgi:hypothetical protein
MDKAMHDAMIGYGTFNVLKIENTLKFGTYNDRPQKSTKVNKIITSFENHGHQWFKEANALAMVIDPACVGNLEELEEWEWEDPEGLREIVFEDEDTLLMASGLHCVAALQKMAEGYVAERDALEKNIECLASAQNPTDEAVEEYKTLRDRLAIVLHELESTGMWSVKLYDRSQYSLIYVYRSPSGLESHRLRLSISTQLDYHVPSRLKSRWVGTCISEQS